MCIRDRVSHEQTLPTQTKYNDNVIASSHQDIEQRHLIVPTIEELECQNRNLLSNLSDDREWNGLGSLTHLDMLDQQEDGYKSKQQQTLLKQKL